MFSGKINYLSASSQERARETFFEELDKNSLKEIAFAGDLVATLISLGKVNKKTTATAITRAYQSQHDSSGYGGNLDTLSSVFTAIPQVSLALESFTESVVNIGFDQNTTDRGDKRESYDAEISHAIVNEGILIDYCLPDTFRKHAVDLASHFWEPIETSSCYKGALSAILGSEDSIPSASSDKNVEQFDRRMLSSFYMIRRLCSDVAHKNMPPGMRLRGPTAWSLRGFESLVIQQFLAHFPTEAWRPLGLRYSELINRVHVQEYTLRDTPGVTDKIKFMQSLPRCIEDARKFTQELAGFIVHHDRLGELADKTESEASNFDYRTAPPRCAITVENPNFSNTGFSMNVTLMGTMLTFQLFNLDEKVILQWTLDTNNHFRSTARSYHLPYYADDLDMSQEDFDILRNNILDISDKAAKGLYSHLDTISGFYSTKFDVSAHVLIRHLPNELYFAVGTTNKDALESAIEEAFYDVECEILATPSEKKDSDFTIRVLFPEASDSEVVTSSRDMDETFLSRYCHDYQTLLNALKKFGVTESTGKGSHEGLNRLGHKYITSQRLRGGDIPLSKRIVLDMLKTLQIPVYEFMMKTERRVDEQ
jgi:hypothetical protein